MIERCAWSYLASSAGNAGSAKHCNVLIDDTLFGHDGLPRRSERIVASFGNRRLVEAMFGV